MPALKSVLLFFLILSAFELGARVVVKCFGHPYEKSWFLLKQDPDLGWRQRPNLETTFLDGHVETNHYGMRDVDLNQFSDRKTNILILGPSSTFGWGVSQAETYSAFLQEELDKTTNQAKATTYKVWNAGQIGFTTLQGLKFFKSDLSAYKFDYVILAYGLNEQDHYRFFRQTERGDISEFENAEPANIIFDSFFLRHLLFKMRDLTWRCPAKPTMKTRLTWQDFLKFAPGQLSQINAKKIFLTTSIRPVDGDFSQAKYEDQFSKVIQNVDQKNCAEANRELKKLNELEVLRVKKDVGEWNSALKTWSAESSHDLVDLNSLSLESADFVDPVHFSVVGNRKIGKLLKGYLVRNTK